MNRYKIKMRNIRSGTESVDFEYADNEEMLAAICKERGLEVVDILEEQDISIPTGPAPNLDAIADLGISIDERAMAAAQRAHQASLYPGMPPQPTPGVSRPGQQQYAQSPQPQPQPMNHIIEFVDNGVAYRIVNGQAHKKDWVEVDPSEFRVLKKENKKEIPQDSILVYRKDWVAVEDLSHD